MILTHAIRLNLNNKQQSWFARCAGTSRFAYNWGLEQWKNQYERGENPTWMRLNAQLNAEKKNNPNLQWITDLPAKIPNAALENLGKAFSGFFRRLKLKQNPGYPKFKKKGRSPNSFSLVGSDVKFESKRIKIPKLGWVRIRTPLRFPGKVLSIRCIERAGQWYAAVAVDIDMSCWSYTHSCKTQAVTGIDLGLNTFATLADGTKISAPRSLRKNENKLRKLSKELSRKTKGGKNWKKTANKLGRLHKQIADIRNNAVHNLTAYLVENFQYIGIEDLAVKALARSPVRKSILDSAFAEVRKQLIYKSILAKSHVVIVDRWFPSSKRCSNCAYTNQNHQRGTRTWTCSICRTTHDRDINAALNLKNLAAAHAATACCPGSAGSSSEERNFWLGRNTATLIT